MRIVHQIDAGLARDIGQQATIQYRPRATHIVPRLGFGDRSRRLELVDRGHTLAHPLIHQPERHLGRQARIPARAVDLAWRETDGIGDPIQARLAQLAEQPHGEAHRIQSLVDQRWQVQAPQFRIDEPDVESDVMSNDERIADELGDLLRDCAEARRVLNHLVGDRRQPGDELGDCAIGVQQCFERLDRLTPAIADDSDLDHALAARLQAGRLDIQRDELIEQQGRGAVRRGMGRNAPIAVGPEHEPVVATQHTPQQRSPQRGGAGVAEDVADEQVLVDHAALGQDKFQGALAQCPIAIFGLGGLIRHHDGLPVGQNRTMGR
jgi:hypothetical protein